MPIKPEHKHLYPENWSDIVDRLRTGRADNRCESCRRPHLEFVWTLEDGSWMSASGDKTHYGQWYDANGQYRITPDVEGYQMGLTRVVLAGCHRGHDPQQSNDEDIAIWCQRCHMIHDHAEHWRRRKIGIFQARAMADLFEGPYEGAETILTAWPAQEQLSLPFVTP